MFNFLRNIFRDEEYLKLKERLIALEKEVSILKTDISQKKDEKVDIEFISFLWVITGIIAAFMFFVTQVGLEAINKLTNLTFLSNYKIFLDQGIRLIVSLVLVYSTFLLIDQISFGLDLLREYSKQKHNNKYLVFAKKLRWIYIFFIFFLLLFIAAKIKIG